MKTGLFVLLAWCATGMSQDYIDIINDQARAFNSHDIQTMVSNLHADFKWYYVMDDELTLETDSRDQFATNLKSYYTQFPEVRSQIVEYSIVGDKVSFKEEVHWTNDKGKKGVSTAIGVYQFKGDKIYRVWYY
ncbi:MAG: nuclear transport factor 2 family protein [Flavobacteriales bacterium]